MTTTPLTATEDDPAGVSRAAAHGAHARGDLGAAIAAQTACLAALEAVDRLNDADMLFLALLHFQANDTAQSLAVIDHALTLFPAAAPLHENRGVLLMTLGNPGGAIEACLQALQHGGGSPNIHDCLADASGRIGRLDDAVRHGRDALEAKERMFCASPPVRITMPGIPAGPFNPHNPAENIIAYTLWGNSQRYVIPLMENLRLIGHLFPGWTARIYLDDTVPAVVQQEFVKLGGQVVQMTLPPGLPGHRRLLWRFAVVADPAVRRFLVRDADSLLTVKERVAVDAWLASSFHFHVMRDFYTHTDLMLAGMWGGVGGILPDPETLMAHFRGWRAEGNHVDQDLLSELIWPSIRGHCLVHDSVFTGCLGSVAFPPYGALPPGQHIGENAYIRLLAS